MEDMISLLLNTAVVSLWRVVVVYLQFPGIRLILIIKQDGLLI